MGRWLCGAMGVIVAWTTGAQAVVVTFEDQMLAPGSYWNGSDGAGEFRSGAASFKNSYFADWSYWEGFACSNCADSSVKGFAAQYNAIPGGGRGGSRNYALAYYSSWPTPKPAFLVLDQASLVKGLYVTNTNWAYYWMVENDIDDPNYTLLLTITGRDAGGNRTERVEFYLADFRRDGHRQPTLIREWTWVDLRSLGQVKALEFALTSTDAMTPTYVAVDTLVLQGLVGTGTGIHGFVDRNTRRPAGPKDHNAMLHPVFKAWATQVADYRPALHVTSPWQNTAKALGPVTGQVFDVVSLGDLWPADLAAGQAPGSITLTFGDPVDPNAPNSLRDGPGFDFAVFENGFMTGSFVEVAGSVSGRMQAELGFVEVSTNGRDFARFPSLSLAGNATGTPGYETIDVGRVCNLAGGHPNNYAWGSPCMGTAFDLQDLAGDPRVVAGQVNLADIRYIRIVDIPGHGDFADQADEFIDPCSWPSWTCYDPPHPIHDQLDTYDSGGFDLEAVGILSPQQYRADVNLDGRVDQFDFALLASAWKTHLGQQAWLGRADLTGDLVVDCRDLAVLAGQWLETEAWLNGAEH